MEDYFLNRYAGAPVIVYGFHGCTKDTEVKIIDEGEEIKDSTNDYDWLGRGKYFWESNPMRALEWAKNHCDKNGGEPAVIGACIDLSSCLNLVDSSNLKKLKITYQILENMSKNAGYKLPTNDKLKGYSDRLLRRLDCLVVNATCRMYEDADPHHAYTTVRGVFWEGNLLYPDAGFKERNHIQICVRDPRAILCYFRPRYFDIKKNLCKLLPKN